MIGTKIVLNGELIPAEEAKVGIDNIEFSYGYGVYESLKVRKGSLYFAERHAKRLLNSAEVIGLETDHSEEEIVRSLQLLGTSIKEQSYNIKMLLIGSPQGSDLYVFATSPLFVPKRYYTQGVRVITLRGERQFKQAKSLSMLSSYLAFKEAKKQGAYDALMIDRDGLIHEGTRTNIFYTDGVTLYTPPKEHVLEGVTRSTLMQALEEEGITVEERPLREEELNTFTGYFITSTSTKVLPISMIDGKEFTIPDMIKRTISIYNRFLERQG